MRTHSVGELVLGQIPRVVGTVATRGGLQHAKAKEEYTCDIVEVRLDEIGEKTPNWMQRCQVIETMDMPVILTLRLEREGGKWKGPDRSRKAILAAALETLSTIDIESTSELRKDMCAMAQHEGKSIVVSYHDFDGTPSLSKLQKIVDDIMESSCAIPKIATMVKRTTDMNTLAQLIARYHMRRPLCVIGMGRLGTSSRVTFPSLGSCLTYGYLDTPSALGQLHAESLVEQIRQLMPDYNQEVIARKEILECV